MEDIPCISRLKSSYFLYKILCPFLGCHIRSELIVTILAPEVMDPLHTVKPKNSTTLMVSFNLKTGATHYIIRVQNSDGFFREDRVSSSPAEVEALTPYTEYTLSIMAANGGGRSQPSRPVTAKTGTVVCQFNVKEFFLCVCV